MYIKGMCYTMKMFALFLFGFLAVGCVSEVERTGTTEIVEAPEIAPAEYSVAPIMGEAPELPPIAVYIDSSVSHQAEAKAAVEAWGRVFAGVREWTIVASKADAMVSVSEVGKFSHLCPDDASGCTDAIGGLLQAKPGAAGGIGGTVTLITGAYESAAKLVVMHELGHLLGLTHASGGDLMAPKWTTESAALPWVCPDSESIARLEWITHLDLVDCGAQ